jgi:hypothetical protein
MEKLSPRKLTLALCAGVAALAISAAPAFAQHVGGSSRGGGGGHAGAYGGGYRGGYGGYGGYRGGYGYRGYGGWGWRGGGYWGPWGWGLGGLGLGLYFATLPYYYSTYWWGGVPYYYADNTYYRWDGGAGQYITVAPPAGAANQADAQSNSPGQPAAGQPGAGQPPMSELMVYPKNGQGPEQVGKDKYECHKWASSQTGFDPTQAGGTAPNRRSDYMRAQAACLEGRGYSVK